MQKQDTHICSNHFVDRIILNIQPGIISYRVIIKVVLVFLWIVTASLEGCRDGFLYHYRTNSVKKDSHNIHWLFTFERSVVMSLICWINAMYGSMLNTGVLALSLIMIFSFIHNGIYYKTRNYLDKNVYPKGWWDSSQGSESMIELTTIPRTFMAFVGFIGILSICTFN